ncbi:hypothetical protein BV898_06160 [Hypsibius exemplaris]|uniref:G-protein coupled receptors family 1 profile domain-containing protein n=1 Tax=Hypsibius exemplaris TaxID=2072580 RepID=A0A1W0WXL5_HYPEX|nr:hypothetical protein BV898_06160 [Hypsibius exemplaris]
MLHVTRNATADNISQYYGRFFGNNSSDNSTQSTEVLDDWWLRITFCVFMGLLAVSGTIGNCFVIFSILMVKELRKLRNVFILNLGISDLLVNAISMPFNILGAVNSADFWHGKGVLCQFIATICVPGCSSSLYSIAAIAFERYLCICHLPLHHRLFSRPLIPIIMMIILWVNAHLIHLPNHVGWGEAYYDENFFLCWLDLRLWSYSFFYAFVSVIIPIGFCFFAYFRIYLTIRKTTLSRNLITQAPSRKNESEADRIARSAWREEIMLVKTLFKLFLVFIVSWGPVAVLFIFNKTIDAPRWVNLLAILMAHGNSATNSLLYYWLNGHWKTTVRSARTHLSKVQWSGVHAYGGSTGMSRNAVSQMSHSMVRERSVSFNAKTVKVAFTDLDDVKIPPSSPTTRLAVDPGFIRKNSYRIE